jgi:hypothetical protein
MQSDPNGNARIIVYTLPVTSPKANSIESMKISSHNADGTQKSKRAISEKAARGAGRSWIVVVVVVVIIIIIQAAFSHLRIQHVRNRLHVPR